MILYCLVKAISAIDDWRDRLCMLNLWLSKWNSLLTNHNTSNCGSVVDSGTTLHVRISQVRFTMRSLDFLKLSNPSSRTVALGSTQHLTEMSIRNLPGGKGRPAGKADNLTAICEPTVKKMWELRRLTTLLVSTVRYRRVFLYTVHNFVVIRAVNERTVDTNPYLTAVSLCGQRRPVMQSKHK
jgi:hypothetical protein